MYLLSCGLGVRSRATPAQEKRYNHGSETLGRQPKLRMVTMINLVQGLVPNLHGGWPLASYSAPAPAPAGPTACTTKIAQGWPKLWAKFGL